MVAVWLVVMAGLSVVNDPYALVGPYSTWELPGSLVFHVMVALFEDTDPPTLLITGAPVSAAATENAIR
jgi:hypothetical protein